MRSVFGNLLSVFGEQFYTATLTESLCTDFQIRESGDAYCYGWAVWPASQ